MMQSPANPKAALRQQKLQKRLELVHRYPQSMLLTYDPLGLFGTIMASDRLIRRMQKAIFSGTVTMEEFRDHCARYREVARGVWESLVKLSPRLLLAGQSPLDNWRAFNETPHEKEMLIHRANRIVFIPRSEESAILGILHKLIYRTSIEINTLQEDSTAAKMFQLGEISRKMKSDLEALNEELKSRLGSD